MKFGLKYTTRQPLRPYVGQATSRFGDNWLLEETLWTLHVNWHARLSYDRYGKVSRPPARPAAYIQYKQGSAEQSVTAHDEINHCSKPRCPQTTARPLLTASSCVRPNAWFMRVFWRDENESPELYDWSGAYPFAGELLILLLIVAGALASYRGQFVQGTHES